MASKLLFEFIEHQVQEKVNAIKHDELISDDLHMVAGKNWVRMGEDRAQWSAVGEDYVYQWNIRLANDDEVKDTMKMILTLTD